MTGEELSSQRSFRVAYLGPKGSFTHQVCGNFVIGSLAVMALNHYCYEKSLEIARFDFKSDILVGILVKNDSES